jgi:ribosome small subunit-dependent GTPase A
LKRGKRPNLAKDLTADYLSGQFDHDRAEGIERFGRRSKFNQQFKTQRTHDRRLADRADELDKLPTGRVIEVHGLYCTITPADSDASNHSAQQQIKPRQLLAVVPKTVQRTSTTRVIVGDIVRYSPIESPEPGAPQARVEAVLDRKTILCRADSFKAREAWPIVANAEQMLIVAAVVEPRVKWGLIDRMILAARTGGLIPILCLNKIDLITPDSPEAIDLDEKLAHYATLGIDSVRTSVTQSIGLEPLRERLRDRSTVFAGHSGVGKSSIANGISPDLDLRVGDISHVHHKGKHTTTSARIFTLPMLNAEIIDTPGVKLFGLWHVDRNRVDEFFPDVLDDSAPDWRVESHARIIKSIV